MGRSRAAIDNIENVSPHQEETSLTATDPQRNMKTRSGKTQPGTVTTPAGGGEQAESMIVDAEAIPSSSVIEIPYEVIGNKSPLAESSLNEQTPEKEATQALEKTVTISQGIEATPTANLKILCEAVDHDESTSSGSILVTSGKGDPVTPTANLKMLITAASPEIRSLELSKSRLFADDEEEDDEDDDETPSKRSNSKSSTTRKQKSLGVLCRRFMAQFDENPPQTSRIEVCLDELATHLGTERRRIYDIVNVLESVEMMSRRAKNRYLWHGKTNLNATLVKLKYFAETEKVAKQLELVRELELARLYGRKSKNNGYMQSEVEAVSHHPKYKEYMDLFGDAHKKERSLGVMSQKFLMLFLTGRTKTINLDMAAKILLGDPMVETKQTNSQFKTKIRRLYDIANILASINLICKVHVTELRGRKPAFSYIGPDVEELSSLEEYQYLKNVEVVRPGRTTLDMKMEELKRKMEAHLAAQQAADRLVQQVPPVTVQAPDMEEIRQNMSAGSGRSLSLLAGEHAATKKERAARELKPKSARPFVVIQGVGGGSTSVVTTNKVPNFMDISQVSVASQEQFAGVTLLPAVVQTMEGNQVFVTASSQAITSPISVSSVNTTPNTSMGTRRILPAGAATTTQTLTLYTPPSKPTTEVLPQQKRTLAQAFEAPAVSSNTLLQAPPGSTSALVQAPDGTFSTFFLTKSDNEYFLINKKAKTDAEPDEGEQEAAEPQQSQVIVTDGAPQHNQVLEVVSEETVASAEHPHNVQVFDPSSITPYSIQVHNTPVSSHLSPAPVPVVYSTPSGLSTLAAVATPDVASQPGTKGAYGITGTQITFLASPIVTPAGTPVVSRSQTEIDPVKQLQSARKLTLK